MNKTLNINLAGLIFHIDEEAFNQLERYLETLKRQFRKTEGGNEIVSDIETRIAELFRERTTESKEVINLTDVLEVIEVMGQPEDYIDSDEQSAQTEIPPGYSRSKRIFRDPDNRVIGGVSSGVAAYFNIDPIWIRLLFIILLFSGPGFLVYIIMWIVIPKAKTTADKLIMRGEPVNISNIQRSIKEEFSDMKTDYRAGRSRDGIGGFINELGRFIMDAIRLIFKFAFKVIGFLLLFAGFLLLFSLVVALVMGTVDINGTDVSLQYALNFLELVTANSSHFNMLFVGIILSIAAPVFLLIYFGIRILFDLDPLNRPTKSGLALTTLIGLVLLAVSAGKIAHEFQDNADVSYDLSLPSHQQYYLTAGADSITQMYDEDYNFNTNWLPLGKENAFNLVDVNVEPTEEAKPYLEVIRESQGVSRMQARNHAESVRYEVLIQDSVITVPIYYILAENEKFRAQKVEVNLYLPSAHSVYFDYSIADYLYDVDNLQNMWDYDMAGKLWHMTENGLSCDGCEIPGELDEEEWQDSLYESEKERILEEEIIEDMKDEETEESGDLVFEFDETKDDHQGHVLYETIARPIEEKVTNTTLNILKNHIRLHI
jgi:phage shock protein PspC (stress-responsive transcriptional regulator)